MYGDIPIIFKKINVRVIPTIVTMPPTNENPIIRFTRGYFNKKGGIHALIHRLKNENTVIDMYRVL